MRLALLDGQISDVAHSVTITKTIRVVPTPEAGTKEDRTTEVGIAMVRITEDRTLQLVRNLGMVVATTVVAVDRQILVRHSTAVVARAVSTTRAVRADEKGAMMNSHTPYTPGPKDLK